ncbi:RNA polymerase II transcriptional coactivator KIWI-like [Phragmites australis]|uniref:RNA polymerase II transcriptional coactivator KIWI-like n=1 Tax=Phragmites australis TaxID=29695 RepID=UPI002D79A993|nr:RNA polymerase II transcriptional coactivator KIWI-like [Phragmites australis]
MGCVFESTTCIPHSLLCSHSWKPSTSSGPHPCPFDFRWALVESRKLEARESEMWGKGKKRFGAGGGEPAAKRQAAGEDGPSESADDDIVVAEISKNKRVAVRSWKGKVFVDIREFYVKDGKTLPTRKGISLQMDQWKILRDNIKAIDEAVKENAR